MEEEIESLEKEETVVADFKPKFDSLEALHRQVQDALIFNNPHTHLSIEVCIVMMMGFWFLTVSDCSAHVNFVCKLTVLCWFIDAPRSIPAAQLVLASPRHRLAEPGNACQS